MNHTTEIFCNDLIIFMASYLPIKDFIKFTHINKNYKNFPYKSLKTNFINKINEFLNITDKTDNFSKNLIDIIGKYDQLSLQGTFLLDLINDDPFDNNTEIDIFCKHNIKNEIDNELRDYDFLCKQLQTYEPYNVLRDFLFSNDFDILRYNFGRRVENEDRPNQLQFIKDRYYFIFTKYVDEEEIKIIKIYIVPQNQIINNISFSNNFYDGKKLFLSNPDHIINKSGKFDFCPNTFDSLSNDFLETTISTLVRRFEKYYLKNYKILIDIKIIKKLCEVEEKYNSDPNFEVYLSKNIIEYIRTIPNFLMNTDSVKFYTITGRCFEGHQNIYDFKINSQDKQYILYNNDCTFNYNSGGIDE